MTGITEYDEFGLFHENASEAGLSFDAPPVVARVETTLQDGRAVSALRWGTTTPELVFLHGGGQNAHTWDTVALALGRPLLAVDLPGHGHSGDVDVSRPVGARSFAEDIAPAVREHAPEARCVVGMSLGGLTAIALATHDAELVRRLFLVDVTPGVNREKASDVVKFLDGPETFDSFDEILERTMAFNPTRTESSLRRGILHNAVQREDGRWVWRHQRGGRSTDQQVRLDPSSLWDDVAAVAGPVHLAVGGRSPVVDEDDVTRFREAQPGAGITTVDDAGHSIQGDQPVELARLIEQFLS